MVKQDNFLADELGRNKLKPHITFMDGFRFGIGSMVGVMLVLLVTAGIAWGIIVGLKLH